MTAVDVYIPGTSPLHRWDPRAKLMVGALYTASVLAIPVARSWVLFCFGALLVSAFGASRLPAGRVLIRLGPVAGLIGLAGLGMLFEGSPARFVSVSGKAALCAGCGVLMAATTQFGAMLAAMRSFRFPDILTAVSGLAHRHVFVALDEACRMMVAYRCRVPQASPLRRLRHTTRLALALCLRSAMRTERIERCLLVRGFDGVLRTLPLTAPTRADVVATAATAIVCGALLVVGYL